MPPSRSSQLPTPPPAGSPSKQNAEMDDDRTHGTGSSSSSRNNNNAVAGPSRVAFLSGEKKRKVVNDGEDDEEDELNDSASRKKSHRPSSPSGAMQLKKTTTVKFTEIVGDRSRWIIPTGSLIAHASMNGESRPSFFLSFSLLEIEASAADSLSSFLASQVLSPFGAEIQSSQFLAGIGVQKESWSTFPSLTLMIFLFPSGRPLETSTSRWIKGPELDWKSPLSLEIDSS